MFFKLSWISLGLILSSAILDITTTIRALSLGYIELNPMYYILGQNGFFIFFFALTGVACILLWLLDHFLLNRISGAWIRAVILLGCVLTFSFWHFYGGIHNITLEGML